MENPIKSLRENDPVPDKTIVPVASGKVRKKNGLEKFAGMIVQSDISAVKETIISEVVVPMVKNLIANTVSDTVYMMMFGETRNARENGRRSNASYVSYGSMYRNVDDQRPSRRASSGYEFEDVVVPTRGEAEMILDRMKELISVYKVASVADLYDLAGISSKYTDNKYGWTDMHGAEVIFSRGEYVIKMPRACPLD